MPQVFAGRQSEFDDDFLSVALPRALDGRYEQARLVTGARGMGKTALLRELEHGASTAGHWTVRVSATRADAVLGDLVQTLAERVADKDSRAWLTGALRSALERIEAVRIAGSGVELAPAERPLSDRGRARGLAQLLIEAGLLARQRGRAIVLLVDEAQNMDRPAVGDLFHALREAQNHTLDVTHPAGATVRAWLPLVVWVAADLARPLRRPRQRQLVRRALQARATRAVRLTVGGEALQSRAHVRRTQSLRMRSRPGGGWRNR